ncbi:hypothetical protein Syun_005380 [Stephania yunnanensis]|uniref:Uncharacterized protein n=1 Tax=Stephania yunnanensis TaxID=152371 RepID=A0AAP0L646_9MAGN
MTRPNREGEWSVVGADATLMALGFFPLTRSWKKKRRRVSLSGPSPLWFECSLCSASARTSTTCTVRKIGSN